MRPRRSFTITTTTTPSNTPSPSSTRSRFLTSRPAPWKIGAPSFTARQRCSLTIRPRLSVPNRGLRRLSPTRLRHSGLATWSLPRGRQPLPEGACLRQCHGCRFLERHGAQLEEACRQDHADLRYATRRPLRGSRGQVRRWQHHAEHLAKALLQHSGRVQTAHRPDLADSHLRQGRQRDRRGPTAMLPADRAAAEIYFEGLLEVRFPRCRRAGLLSLRLRRNRHAPTGQRSREGGYSGRAYRADG